MDKRTQAWLIIGGSCAFLGLLIGAKLIVSPKLVCDPEVKSKTVILIDHSEAVATQTLDAIVERAWALVESETREGELVSVFNLSKMTRNELKPAFSACKPRKDGSRGTEDVRRIKREFEEKFKKPLRAELAAPIGNSDESPIAQALVDLSLDDLRFRSTDVTRLAVFSDFIENSPGFSMYKCQDPARAIEQFRASRLGAVERPTFRNVDVRMNIIPRRNVARAALQF
ncbi:MAG: hypothetical protein FJX72_17280, partial [Armatimonadetes bacterium]|nr:hypothetical protein [Armatimonadota bacterium]